MSLLGKFNKFVADNYPGKASAIKTTTMRIFGDIDIALDTFIQFKPKMPIVKILQSPDFHYLLTVKDWKGNKVGRAKGLIPEVPNKYKDDPYASLFNIVWHILEAELSYDPTFGTGKDFKLVSTAVENYVSNHSKFSKQEKQRDKPAKRKKSRDSTTVALVSAILSINKGVDKFNEWLNGLLDSYKADKNKINRVNMLSFELGFFRLSIYFLGAQKYYANLYPDNDELSEIFFEELVQHFMDNYPENYESRGCTNNCVTGYQ